MGRKLSKIEATQVEWHSIAKSSKQHRPRVKCPGCQFEGEKESVKVHAIFFGHIQRRKGQDPLPADVIDEILK